MIKEQSKAALEAWLRENGGPVVTAINQGARPVNPVGVRMIRERSGVGVFELTCDSRRAIVKVFDNRSKDARNACEREAFALHTMRQTGLVPRLITFAPDEAFVVTEFVEGTSVEALLTEHNLIPLSQKIGAWLARYIACQPMRHLDLDWFSYLGQYTGVITDAVKEQARAQFGSNRIAAFALAKNDLAPENFIQRDDGTLVGIDFERSRFKPIGWDVIAAAWVLIKRFPGREDDFIPALIDGWNSAGAAEAPHGFEALTMFFAKQAQGLNWKRTPYKL